MFVLLVCIVTMSVSLPSNLELAEQCVFTACETLPEELIAENINRINLELEGDHEAGWLVLQSVNTVLNENGITVVQPVRPEDSDDPVLHIRVMDLSLRYGEVERSWFLGTRRMNRVVTVELAFSIINPDGELVLSDRLSSINQHKTRLSDIDHVACETYEWLSPEIERDEGGGIIEPLVVTGVVASLIYLFYSSRAE